MHPTQVCLYNEELIVKCTGIMAVSFILQKANDRPNVLRERSAPRSKGAIYGRVLHPPKGQ